MYCPKCKYEYREGFTECSDCKTSLVEELPTEKINVEAPVEFKEIRSSLRADEVSVIKSILDANGINYVINSPSSTMYPIPGLNRLMIKENDCEIAIKLLKDFL